MGLVYEEDRELKAKCPDSTQMGFWMGSMPHNSAVLTDFHSVFSGGWAQGTVVWRGSGLQLCWQSLYPGFPDYSKAAVPLMDRVPVWFEIFLMNSVYRPFLQSKIL